MHKIRVENENGDFWEFSPVADNRIDLVESRNLVPKQFYFDVSNEFSLLVEFSAEKNFFVKQGDGILSFSPGRYLLFKPPFSITEIAFDENSVCFSGKLLRMLESSDIPEESLLFNESDFVGKSDEELLNGTSGVIVTREINELCCGIALKIKDIIDRRYREYITLQEIAKELRLSSSLLSIHFKKSFHISPALYRKQLRLKSSSLEIVEKKRNTIADIACENGYGDISRFNKQFKEFTGTTPSKLKVSNT